MSAPNHEAPALRKFGVLFLGRTVGALGIVYRCERVVEVPNVAAIERALRDKHEKISLLEVFEVLRDGSSRWVDWKAEMAADLRQPSTEKPG